MAQSLADKVPLVSDRRVLVRDVLFNLPSTDLVTGGKDCKLCIGEPSVGGLYNIKRDRGGLLSLFLFFL